MVLNGLNDKVFEIELHFRGEKQVLAYLFSANVHLQNAPVITNSEIVPIMQSSTYIVQKNCHSFQKNISSAGVWKKNFFNYFRTWSKGSSELFWSNLSFEHRCHCRKLFTFSPSPELLGQFRPNLAQIILGLRGFKFVQIKDHALFQGR